MSETKDEAQPGLLTLGAFLLILLVIYVLNEVLPGPYGSDVAMERARKGEQTGEALQHYNRAIRLNPERYDAYFERARYRMRVGDSDRALWDYTEALRLKPDMAPAYYNRGLIRSNRGEADEAIADFELAHRYAPKDVEAPFRLVEIWRELGAYDRALGVYDGLIALEPKALSHYVGRAELKSDQGDHDGAIADLDLAIASGIETAGAFVSRGRLKREKGDFAGAISDFDKALDFNVTGKDALLERARAQKDLGQLDAAKTTIELLANASPPFISARWEHALIMLIYLDQAKASAEALDKAVTDGLAHENMQQIIEFGLRALAGTPGPRPDRGQQLANGVPLFPMIDYLAIWRHIARRRSGQDDREELADALRKIKGWHWEQLSYSSLPVRTAARMRARWPEHLLAFYAGKIGPDVVRNAGASAAGAFQRRRRQCEAELYIGMHEAATGEAARAGMHLREAVAICPPGLPEAGFARAELARLMR